MKALGSGKKKRLIAAAALLLVLAAVFLAEIGGCTLVFTYEGTGLDGGVSRMYFDEGSDFSESNAQYVTIRDGEAVFQLKSYFRTLRMRYVPYSGQADVRVLSARVLYRSFVIKEIGESELVDRVIRESSRTDMGPYQMRMSGWLEGEASFVDYPAVLVRGKRVMLKLFALTLLRSAAICLGIAAAAAAPFAMRRFRKREERYRDQKEGILAAAAVLLLWLLRAHLSYPLIFVLLVPLFALLAPAGEERTLTRAEIVRLVAALVLLSAGLSCANTYLSRDTNGALHFYRALTVFLMTVPLYAVFRGLAAEPAEGAEEKEKGGSPLTGLAVVYLRVGLLYFAFQLMTGLFRDKDLSFGAAWARYYTPSAMINLTLAFLAFACLQLLLGRGIAGCALLLVSAVLLIGNAIKIVWHDSFFTPMDFSQIPDMFRIMPKVLVLWQKIGLILLVIALIAGAVVFRKKIFSWLRPRLLLPAGLLAAAALVLFSRTLIRQEYYQPFNMRYMPFISAYTSEYHNGIFVYNFYNFANIGQNRIRKPEEYSASYMAGLEESFDEGKIETSDTKPDVILIMAESLFDMENIPALSFSEEVLPTVHRYTDSEIISPRFGGYTAAIEYEALTGHSLYFYNPGTMPFTTYFDDSVWSIADEFAEAGYRTVAFHPNSEDFYNRKKAYELMGFSDIRMISDITLAPEDLTLGGFCKDQKFAELAIGFMEESTQPTFLFGVSIAAHYTAAPHTDDPTIRVTGEGLADSDIAILEQQTQAFRDSDEMVRMLIDYVDSRTRPTILYVFGDHLPPIPMWDKLDYLDDPYQKYGTVLLAYSNTGEIDCPEKITPNYLAPEILKSAGVCGSSYWNYFLEAEEQLPILHREFVTVQDEAAFADLLKNYEMIQYDLMFGQKYLLTE